MGVQRVEVDGQRTWTVAGEDHLPVGPIEEYLEFLRVAQRSSPNTVRSYATSLARWWEYLTTAGVAWDEVSLPRFIRFRWPGGSTGWAGAAGLTFPGWRICSADGNSRGQRYGCTARQPGRCRCSRPARSRPSWISARGGTRRPASGRVRYATGCCSPRSPRPA